MSSFALQKNGIINSMRDRGWVLVPHPPNVEDFIKLTLRKEDGRSLTVNRDVTINQGVCPHFQFTTSSGFHEAWFDLTHQRFYFGRSSRTDSKNRFAIGSTYNLTSGFDYIDQEVSGKPPDASREEARRHAAMSYPKPSLKKHRP